MPERSYGEAIRDALAEEMRRDPKVFIMGEDVGLYGGAYGATRGLFDEFGPERVRDTPISEMAITGAATGAAMAGYRPVAEIMYMDFMTLAMDQFVNQAAKNRYMFGGKTTVPMVLRTEGGAGRGIAAQHSQSLEAWFLHAPGVLVAMPATPYDAKGMLKTAIRSNDPVLFAEHKMLYKTKGEVPDDDYTIPFGRAAVRREGSDVTIVSYSRMSLVAMEAADRIGARCCVNIAGSRGEKWDGPSALDLTDDTFDMIVELVRGIIDAAKPTRTYYTIEGMPWMYPDSPESYLRLIEAVDRERLAVHLDPANWISSPQRFFGNADLIRESFAKLGKHVRSCHAKDIALGQKLTTHLDEVRPGKGGLDYAAFLRELAKLPPNTPPRRKTM
jgi:pyruvate/2-oxoglutarate/acetoin dehydrogenase E1 component